MTRNTFPLKWLDLKPNPKTGEQNSKAGAWAWLFLAIISIKQMLYDMGHLAVVSFSRELLSLSLPIGPRPNQKLKETKIKFVLKGYHPSLMVF